MESHKKKQKEISSQLQFLENDIQTLSSRYEAILAAVPDIIMEVDEKKVYTWANQAGLEFFGEGVIGKEASFYFEGDQETYNRIKSIFEGDENVIYVESWQRRKDGEKRLLAWWCRALKDAGGNVIGAISTARDITESRAIEQQLRFQNQLFQNTLASLSHPFYVIDVKDYTIKMANPATATFGPISVNATCYALTHNSERPCEGKEHICPLEEVKKNKSAVRSEHIHYDKDGLPRYFEIHCFPILADDGEVIQMIEYSLDITERKRVEAALLESEAKWRSLTEHSPDHITLLDRNAKILFINHTVSGLSREQVIGKSFYDYALPEYRKITKACFQRVLKTGKPDKFESTYQHTDGTLQYFESDVGPVLQGGKIVGLTVSSRDVTDRKHAEFELRNALETTRQRQAEVTALLAGARAVMQHHEFKDAAQSIFDACKNLIGATAGYVALLNKEQTNNDLLFLESGGQTCTVDPSLPMPIRGLRERAYRSGKTIYENDFANSEWTSFLPNGHARLDNVLFAPLKLNGKAVGLLGIANKPGGFTENDARMATAFAELASLALINSHYLESVEASERRFRSITQTASDAIITINSQGKILFCNQAAEKIFGYSVDDMYDKPITLLMPERYRRAHEKGMQRVLSTGKSKLIGKSYEMMALRKDGSEIPVELSVSSWHTKEDLFFTGILRDITERKQMQQALKKSHDELERRVDQRTNELEQANTALRKEIASHKRAARARKIAERQLAEQRLLSMRSDRLRSLGQMAAGIAHELNQPLVGVRGLAEHLLIGLNRGWDFTEDKLKEKLALIIEQADRMSHIIEHVRLFAREAGTPEMHRVQVNEVVRSAMDLLRVQLQSHGILLESELCQDENTILANPFSLEEVILNLMINACDAVEEKLSASSDSMAARILLRTSIEPTATQKLVKIQVIDNGIGIQDDLLPHVFDPFFTSKGPDKGTGLGLSICKSIIEQFRGTIDIHSVFKQGATVTITLPLAEE